MQWVWNVVEPSSDIEAGEEGAEDVRLLGLGEVVMELGSDLAQDDLEGLGVLLTGLASLKASTPQLAAVLERWSERLQVLVAERWGGLQLSIS